MMRRYHRWLSVLFGLLILWIAVTGVLSQIGSLVNNGGFEQESREAGKPQASASVIPSAEAHEPEAAAAPATAAFTCPADMTCRPKRVPKPGDWNVGFLHHIHSGEEFGPVGVVLSMLSGVALIFFAFSGLWMYIQMFRRRAHRASHPKRIFW
jgi:uncharacterized iron-regulated membrane protein